METTKTPTSHPPLNWRALAVIVFTVVFWISAGVL